jgi:hypothetical protein
MHDMSNTRNGAALLIVLFFGFWTGVLRAQSTNASVSCRVTDDSPELTVLREILHVYPAHVKKTLALALLSGRFRG